MEFALSSVVLLFIVLGVVDLSRAYYFAVSMEGAAREGARHAAWFSTPTRSNTYLDDNDVITAVNQALSGSGLVATFIAQPNCLVPTDGNTTGSGPYPASDYPPTTNSPYVYACYTSPTGVQTGTMPAQPPGASYRLGDVNVQILLVYGLASGFLQPAVGNGLQIAENAHFTIQGQP